MCTIFKAPKKLKKAAKTKAAKVFFLAAFTVASFLIPNLPIYAQTNKPKILKPKYEKQIIFTKGQIDSLKTYYMSLSDISKPTSIFNFDLNAVRNTRGTPNSNINTSDMPQNTTEKYDLDQAYLNFEKKQQKILKYFLKENNIDINKITFRKDPDINFMIQYLIMLNPKKYQPFYDELLEAAILVEKCIDVEIKRFAEEIYKDMDDIERKTLEIPDSVYFEKIY